ncbi:predicted protein [Postia placenta Mad-698-R]|nr:predicted protein [Postia placenta Mad-698-R]
MTSLSVLSSPRLVSALSQCLKSLILMPLLAETVAGAVQYKGTARVEALWKGRTDQIKVYCKACLEWHIAKEQGINIIKIQDRRREAAQTIETITVHSSVGVPLSWIENPHWLCFCDEFLPQAIAATAKSAATVQADGWTGVNNHHLIVFMLTANQETHTVKVFNASSEHKTAENFFKLIESAFDTIHQNWQVEIVAFTLDASGKSCKARTVLHRKYPILIVLDCYAHQINLVVGDYFKLGSSVVFFVWAECADDLIAWLHKWTYILGVLRDIQISLRKTPLTIIHAVITHWTAHYLAYHHLLKLQPTISWVIQDDEACGQESHFIAGTKQAARTKSNEMVKLMKNSVFWESIAHIKCHLEPLAIAANIVQAAHCCIDQVLVIFGYLYHQYDKLDQTNESENAVRKALQQSLEARWKKADQDIFIATVILNPLYRLKAFAPLPALTRAGVTILIERLWQGFYPGQTANDLQQELRDYCRDLGSSDRGKPKAGGVRLVLLKRW